MIMDMTTQYDTDDDSFDEATSQAGGVTKTPVEVILQAEGDSHNVNITNHTQLDIDDDSFDEVTSQAGGVTKTPVEEILQTEGDSHNVDINDHTRGTNPHFVATHNYKGSAGVNPKIPKVVSPINELILDQFTNNYQIFAQNLVDTDVQLSYQSSTLKKIIKPFIILALKFPIQTMYKMQRLPLQMKCAIFTWLLPSKVTL